MTDGDGAHRRPRRAEGYSVEELDGELLLFNAASARIIALNETAALVWNLCDGSRTAEQIASLIAAAYPESAAEIPGDVAEIVALFARHGALSRD